MEEIILNKLYRYEDILRLSLELEGEYPELISSDNIGKSEDGRSIPMLSVGTGDKNIIISSGVHARETINPIVLLKIIQNYAQLYENDESIIAGFRQCSDAMLQEHIKNRGETLGFRNTETKADVLLNDLYSQLENIRKKEYRMCNFCKEYTFHMIPLLNPDGYEIAVAGFDAIQDVRLREQAKKSEIESNLWKANARGIDINRNFPSASWRARFPGDYPASESETKALILVFEKIPAMGYMDFHSRGNTIYYYRKAMPDDYNERQKYIASHLQLLTGFSLMAPSDEIALDDVGGNTVHYYSEYFDQPSFTIETVPEDENFPLNVNYQSRVFQDIVLMPLEFAIAVSKHQKV